jgi:hypothetical protein
MDNDIYMKGLIHQLMRLFDNAHYEYALQVAHVFYLA